MFWSIGNYGQTSPIEAVLEKPGYTLEDILSEDDCIQETKALNATLIHFLREPATVEQLLRYVVVPVDSAEDGADDPKRAFKFPYTSCEIFCCEVDGIFNTLVESEALMALFFSLLDSPKPLNCMHAGYFARVLNALLLRKTNELMAYLSDRPELLAKLVGHMDTTSIAEVLVRLLGADEQTRVFLHAASLAWLADTDVLQQLLASLSADAPEPMQAATADVLTAIAETQLSPLAAELAKPEVLEGLLNRAFAVKGGALVHGLNVAIALLEPRTSARESVSPTAADFLTPQLEVKMKTEAVFSLAAAVPALVHFLDAPPDAGDDAEMATPYGTLSPPLGSARLKVLELLAALARSGMKPAESALLDDGAVARCLSLFAAYPMNNLAHKHIVSLLVTLLESGSDETVVGLFEQCKLAAWLADVQIQVAPNEGGKSHTRVTKPWRAPYMGHVTLLGNRIQAVAGKRPVVAAALDAEPLWAAFLADYLGPQNRLESADSWACGRPNAMDMGGMDSEADDFDGELDLDSADGPQAGVFVGASSGSTWSSYNAEVARYAAVDEDTSDGQRAFATFSLSDKAAQPPTVVVRTEAAAWGGSSEEEDEEEQGEGGQRDEDEFSSGEEEAAGPGMAAEAVAPPGGALPAPGGSIDEDVAVVTAADSAEGGSPSSSGGGGAENAEPVAANEGCAPDSAAALGEDSAASGGSDSDFGFKFWRQKLEVDVEVEGA